MSKVKKYTLETLLPLNVSYDRDHGLTQEDVDMVNSLVETIERTRSECTPKIGDRLAYVDRHGKYYGYALIEAEIGDEGLLSICEQPYIHSYVKVGTLAAVSHGGGYSSQMS